MGLIQTSSVRRRRPLFHWSPPLCNELIHHCSESSFSGRAPPADRPPHCIATYGLTETGSGVVYNGKPLNSVEIEIRDGEVHLRGPMLLRCYRDGTSPLTSDGWLPTGDLGFLRDDGSLHVEGRRGDVINTGGEKVWPDDVERQLIKHPDIHDVAVNGLPDNEWGQIVAAFVVSARPNLSLDEIREHCRAQLPGYAPPPNNSNSSRPFPALPSERFDVANSPFERRHPAASLTPAPPSMT